MYLLYSLEKVVIKYHILGKFIIPIPLKRNGNTFWGMRLSIIVLGYEANQSTLLSYVD